VKSSVELRSFDQSKINFPNKLGGTPYKSVSKPYRNDTGPGEYDQSAMTGKYVIESNKQNPPRFSFGIKQDFYTKKPPTISKQHKIDYYSRDSPGAGTYSPESGHERFMQTSIKFSVPRDIRFRCPDVVSRKVNA